MEYPKKRKDGVALESPVPELPSKASWSRSLAALAFVAAFTCVAQDAGSPTAARPEQSNMATQADAKVEKSEKPSAQTQVELVTAMRRKQIADDSTRLLNMAIALKAEVDKTTKDTLSINVIRKADEIEKLARSVREKMKQSGGGPG
jgi:hypothetical protein